LWRLSGELEPSILRRTLASARGRRISRAFRRDSIILPGFQRVANGLLQAIGAERVIEHDDYRRISAGSDFRVNSARRINNIEAWIIQFEKLRQLPPKSPRQPDSGHQQIYLCSVPCSDPDGFLDTRGLYDSILARESTAFQSTQSFIGLRDQDRVGMPVEQASHNLFQNTGLPFGVGPCLYLRCASQGPF
jgi:hypothetical protein